MSEAQKPVEETPAAAPATTEAPTAPAEAPAAATETPAAEAPKDAPAENNTEAAPAAAAEGEKKDETPAEQPKEENKKEEVTPATEGQLGYKAPGLVKGLRFSKRFLYFSDDAVEAKNLNVFRQNEKPAVANATAAWATQTGKGLLFLTKRSEDKGTPAVIFNLADATDITKESSNEFLFKANGAKHTFQAANAAERDSWVAAVEAKAAAAKSEKEAITGSEGYKAELEKLKNPGAAAAAAAAAAKKPAEKTEEPAENKEEAKKDDKKEEAAAPAEENKENKEAKDKSAKSRSQSRKRASLFGTLLGKKEETEEKKEEKAEKAEKAEESKPAENKEETSAESSKAAEAPAESAPAPEAAEKKEENKEEQKEEPKEETKEEKKEEQKEEKKEEQKEEKKEEQKEEKKEKKTETPAKSKRASFFGGFFQKASSPSQEKTEKEATAPATESSAVANTAPQLDNPVEGAAGKPLEPESVTAPADGEAAKDTSAAQSPAAETPGASKEAKDKRRTSFFGNFGKKKGESSDTEDADGKKGNKLGGLFRKPSKAVKLDDKKETAAGAEDKTENKPEPVAKDAPAEEKPAQEEAKPTEAPAATEESKTNNVASSTPVQAAA